MIARFIARSTMVRVPAVVLPRTFRSFSSSPQKQLEKQQTPTKPDNAPFHLSSTQETLANDGAFMNFVNNEDLEGSAWVQYAATVVETRSRDPEHKRQLAFLTLAFREFDVNRDKVLSKDEVRLALLSLKLPAEDPEVKKMIAELDKNQDNVIQLDEWLDNLPRSVITHLEVHASAARWHKLAWGEDDIGSR